MHAGVALNPHTPVDGLKDILRDIDLVCLMSVNPGFGGQHFIPNTLSKIKELKQLIEQKACSTLIEVDGGVGLNNYREIVAAGANVLVAGNSVYGAIDPIQAILDLKK
jgi:ribulose-phosphate 3-epimerase